MTPANSQVYVCPECQTGHLKPGHITYAAWLDEDDVMLIPQFSAWICDVCGHIDYDENSARLLEALFNGGPSVRRSPFGAKKDNPPPRKA